LDAHNLALAERDGCLWEKVERKTNSRMARVCFLPMLSVCGLIFTHGHDVDF